MKKHLSVAILGILTLALMAGGCKKDEETNPLTGGGTLGQATCQINGAVRTFEGTVYADASRMLISGISRAPADTILLEILINNPSPANGSSFTLSVDHLAVLFYTATNTFYSTDSTSTGTLSIGTNGPTTVTGTFNFNAKQVDGTATKAVTAGSFNFPKITGAAQDAPRIRQEALRLPAGR